MQDDRISIELRLPGVKVLEAQLLALPDHQRPRRGQAQPHQDPEKESLRLPERQELSAKDP